MSGGVGTRRRARECALQVLYALDVGAALEAGAGAGAEQALTRYWQGLAEETDPAVIEFARGLVLGTVAHLADVDGLVQGASRNWRLERMARVDRNVLRLATYELRHLADIPTRVIINEAIELAKRFGAAESPAFVNGLLDRIAHVVREAGKP